MRYKIILIQTVLLFLATVTYGQKKYIDRAGHASFFSEAPLENIEAHNNQALSMLDLGTGDIVASMLMKSFKFEKSLMEEHFNEKYVESEKYPKATFKGKIQDYTKIDLSKDGTYTLNVSGSLTIHGETRPLETKAQFIVKSGVLSANTTFPITIKDFKVPIPTLVIRNIAEVVEVKVSFQYQPAR